MTTTAEREILQKAAHTIRALGIDAIENARSGHPGAPPAPTARGGPDPSAMTEGLSFWQRIAAPISTTPPTATSASWKRTKRWWWA